MQSLATAYMETGELKKAQKMFARLLKVVPAHYDALQGLAGMTLAVQLLMKERTGQPYSELLIKSVMLQVCRQLPSVKRVALHPFHLLVLDNFEIKVVPLKGTSAQAWDLFAKYYEAPGPITPSSQMYSLGCILYHMATNRDPRD